MALRTVKEADFKGKRVIMRVDFNVPMKEGVVGDTTRITSAIPTIKYILEHGAKSLTLVSHLGDPKKDIQKAQEKAQKDGKPFDADKFSQGKHRMKPVCEKLAELLGGVSVKFNETMDTSILGSTPQGGVVVLENIRFQKGETGKTEEERMPVAKDLAKFGEIYVNDAFGTAHRAHASTETLAKLLPSFAGLLIEKEVNSFEPFLNNPPKPFVAVVGGAKVSSKIAILESLLKTANTLIIGGGMSYTFLKAQGHTIGKSLVEDDQLETAKTVISKAKEKNVKIILPVDHVCAPEFADVKGTVVDSLDIPEGMMALDVGPKTISLCVEEIKKAGSVLWNGPMGVFELSNFEEGTKKVGEAIASSSGLTAVGGGDSVTACNKFNLSSRMKHVSTGGGASLELLEGKVLPGIKALEK